MGEDKKESAFKFLISLLTEFFTIGLAVAGAIFAGALTGWFIDYKLLKGKYAPWITTVFIVFGAIGGIKNLIYYSKKRAKKIEKE